MNENWSLHLTLLNNRTGQKIGANYPKNKYEILEMLDRCQIPYGSGDYAHLAVPFPDGTPDSLQLKLAGVIENEHCPPSIRQVNFLAEQLQRGGRVARGDDAVGDLGQEQARRRLDARAGDELPRRLAQKGRNDTVEMAGRKRRHLGQRTQVERFVQMGPDVFDDDVDPPLIIGCRGWFVLHLGDKGILRRGNGLFRFCEFALHHPPESPPA